MAKQNVPMLIVHMLLKLIFPTEVTRRSGSAKQFAPSCPAKRKALPTTGREGKICGLALSDIAVLVRSSTDVRTCIQALEVAGIPSIVRAGPDLYSQPEALMFLGALAIAGDLDEFYGTSQNPQKGLPGRIKSVLSCGPYPK
ncbi:MAG: hypothetical protein M2R45_02991 [Verrucomicrobia subdivision 3 bacterium]|nr:hypothetical protein [Limisphaerales bacterium]MCS1416523.1 hypothetical protein [Limisphaerales bacterium]